MKKDDVLKNMAERVLQENGGAVEYEILYGEEQMSMAEYVGVSDYRLENTLYRRDSFTILGRLHKGKNIFATSTLFVTGFPLYKDIMFWKKTTDGKSLEQVFLGRYADLVGDVCVTLGYTQFVERAGRERDMLSRARMTRMFYRLIYSVIYEMEIFVHVEPCGVCFLEPQFLKKGTELLLNDGKKEHLGEVNPESIVSYKIAKKLGMIQMEELYHDMTLGPVFFSRNM